MASPLATIRDAWRAGAPPSSEQRQGLVQLVETMGRTPTEPIGSDFESFVTRGYHDNGVVWAAVLARFVLFGQARFGLIDDDGERRPLPPRLGILERPWPNGSTAELLARIEQDTSLAGNYYLYRAEPGRLQRLRPDWVDIVLDPGGAEVVGYLYHPGGRFTGPPPIPLLVEEVAHGSPYPDPLRAFRGSSWLQSVALEIMGDKSMTRHKLKFFDNAATPNLLVTVEGTLSESSREVFRSQLEAKFGGWRNAYKTLVLEEGADARVIGSKISELDFTNVQAHQENRIAVAARVPSIVLGIKEGAEQATYSNYGQALQHFANFEMRYLWDIAAETLAQLVSVPAGWRLTFDTSEIAALQSDERQDAEITETQAQAVDVLLATGRFTVESVIDAVTANDLTQLVAETAPGPAELELEDDEGDEPLGALAFLNG